MGTDAADYDRSGHPSVLISNFANQMVSLYHNEGNGLFVDEAPESEIGRDTLVTLGFGCFFFDYDNDGWPDIFLNALSLQGYVLLRNTRGDYEDISDLAGLTALTMPYGGWGTKFVDYDNDGWKDLFVAQGHVMDTISADFPSISYKQQLLLLRNDRGRFEDVSSRGGPSFRVPLAARGAAFGDFDNDGFIDVVVSTNDGAPVLLHNNGNKNNWILINTVGVTSNRDGIGARIHIVGETGLEQYGFVSTSSSYLSASDKRVHFGLGSDRRIRLIEIRWPSGVDQILKDVAANQVLTVKEPR
jgi:hypothetical protein